ncbi:penicillin-binding protein activator LpoB [Crenobacter cavernae]|uniref:Penicillin-binding protein activator LpoB n=1 Tax=Crenobacter cavernae TaxID=2290923 RepID=A0ABY0FGY7_9NEIS|nr:penicillin-binding protein activator LpoB [Crenobacter cavernae]RXZ43989.1 penicillin-binding protein activator LpoB [Crenobacter cavernae]
MLKYTIGLLAGLILAGGVLADAPKVAVTDLAYEERVSEYFRVVVASKKSSLKATSSRSHGSLDADSESSYFEAEGTYSYIDRGELRKFTADIKGEMLKTGQYRLTQPHPYTSKDNEKLYDVIDRIKQGMYPGADYVLFGSVSSLEWRDEVNPVQGTGKYTQTLALDLVADFSLIDTRSYEVKAAFSASGEGQDARFLTGGNRVVPNRGKVVREVSKSLGEDAARQLDAQFSPAAGPSAQNRVGTTGQTETKKEEVIILR